MTAAILTNPDHLVASVLIVGALVIFAWCITREALRQRRPDIPLLASLRQPLPDADATEAECAEWARHALGIDPTPIFDDLAVERFRDELDRWESA